MHVMKGEAQLTINRSKDDWIEVEVRDRNRRTRILSVYIQPDDFTRAITGLARQPGELEYNLDYNPLEFFGDVEGEETDDDV